MPDKEPKPKVVRLKRNVRTLGEVEHIALSRVHFLARLVRDIEAAVDDDLHLVVCVLVDKRSACGEQQSGQSNSLHFTWRKVWFTFLKTIEDG